MISANSHPSITRHGEAAAGRHAQNGAWSAPEAHIQREGLREREAATGSAGEQEGRRRREARGAVREQRAVRVRTVRERRARARAVGSVEQKRAKSVSAHRASHQM